MDLAADAGSAAGLNQKLACIDTTQTSLATAELIAAEAAAGRTDHTYVLISKNKEGGLADAVRSLTGTGNHVLWVLPLLSSDLSSVPQTAPGVTVLPWEVS